jgi:MFS family permease
VALLALASGFGQFGAVAALGSVAHTFGHMSSGATFADEAGLSGTKLGIGLAVIRLASLGGLPLAGLADRFGRRSVLLATCAVGLSLTVVAAGSPSYWWFVAIFALGRPALSATNGVAQVAGVELTSSAERAKAVALVAAGYSVGAGLTAILHGLAVDELGFRGLFALAVVPLALLTVIRRIVVEPDRFTATDAEANRPVIGPVAAAYRGRLALVALVTFGVAVVTGPADSLVFVYAQNVRHVSGVATSAMVVGAGVTGLGGLLVGRWLADAWGRRPAVALGMVAMALFGVLTYSGSVGGLVTGYVLEVAAAAVLAPGGGALLNELFPTSVRASVTGWSIASGVLGAVLGLLAFGIVADVHGSGNHAAFAAAVTFLPAMAFAAVLLFLPETRGREPEELWHAG